MEGDRPETTRTRGILETWVGQSDSVVIIVILLMYFIHTYVTYHLMVASLLQSLYTHHRRYHFLFQSLAKQEESESYKPWLTKLKQKQINETHLGSGANTNNSSCS